MALITSEGILNTPFEFDKVGDFSHGLIPVKKDEKWGYVNLQGECIIDYQFDHAKTFEAALAKVTIGDTEHLINLSGEIVL